MKTTLLLAEVINNNEILVIFCVILFVCLIVFGYICLSKYIKKIVAYNEARLKEKLENEKLANQAKDLEKGFPKN